MSQAVVFHSQLADGEPFFKGTDILVSEVLEQLASGATQTAILQKRGGQLSPEALAEAIRLASQALSAHAAEFLTEVEADSLPTEPAPPIPSAVRGVMGELRLCQPTKTQYGLGERICLRELIRNQTSAPIPYSYLGIAIVNRADGSKQFHTSWSGDLTLPANGEGPTPGGWEDGISLNAIGQYRITMDMCFGTPDEGQKGIGWETLTPPLDLTVGEAGASAPAPAPGGIFISHGIQGNAFSVEKSEVRVNELCWFNFKVTNTSDQPVKYGVLAARTESGQAAQSWTNATLEPRQVLEWRDHMEFANPGTYKLYLGIAYSDWRAAVAMQAPWDRLSDSVTMVVR
jgi:uncharacterized protein (DUF433 family)